MTPFAFPSDDPFRLSFRLSSLLARAGGRAGQVMLAAAGPVSVDRSTVAAQTAATAAGHGAGRVTVDGGGAVSVTRSLVTVATGDDAPAAGVGNPYATPTLADRRAPLPAGSAAGGDVTLTAGTDLFVTGTTVLSTAGSGGDVTLTARRTVSVSRSGVLAQTGGDGGQVTIDPLAAFLTGDVIDGRSTSGGDVAVRVRAGVVVRSGDTDVLSTNTDLPVDPDVVKGLARLGGSPAPAAVGLADRCGDAVGGPDAASSFVVTGPGATPAEPGGWMPTPGVDDADPPVVPASPRRPVAPVAR